MAASALYQVVFLGKLDARVDIITSLLNDRIADLGLEQGEIHCVPESEVRLLDGRLPTIGIFLGYDRASKDDHPGVNRLIEDSNLILTVVSDLKLVAQEIPENLRHINAVAAAPPDGNFDRIVSFILEGFRLLRRERRLFISYKREDSQSVADQLYDALDARGFDVFIDTRTVPPGADFQAELWHRLSDSDVVVLIDTPGFRASRWTKEELAHANATNIQILHLLWPGQGEDKESALSYFHVLSNSNFVINPQTAKLLSLTNSAILEVCQHAERLRARAIAARYRYLVDSFCDAARDRGLMPSIQPQRWISVELPSGKQLAAVPTIGVPTSDRINTVFNSISDAGSGDGGVWVLYDSRGLLSSWMKHLEWLDGYLPVKTISMARADKELGEASK